VSFPCGRFEEAMAGHWGGAGPLGSSQHSVALTTCERCYETMVRNSLHNFHGPKSKGRKALEK
jgi:hypothetical protein